MILQQLIDKMHTPRSSSNVTQRVSHRLPVLLLRAQRETRKKGEQSSPGWRKVAERKASTDHTGDRLWKRIQLQRGKYSSCLQQYEPTFGKRTRGWTIFRRLMPMITNYMSHGSSPLHLSIVRLVAFDRLFQLFESTHTRTCTHIPKDHTSA